MKKEIQRRTKTQEIFKEALIKLLEKKDINKITTLELCKEANLNRSTFYINYYDQYDLYDDIKNELIEECITDFNDGFINEDSIINFLSKIESNNVLRMLLMQKSEQSFAYELKSETKKILEINLSYLFNDKDDEYLYDFLMDGCFGIILRWVKNNMDRSKKEISSLIINTCKNINFYFEKITI